MTVKYDAGLEAQIPDLEVVRLRTEVAELKSQLDSTYKILEENGLAEAKPKSITAEEKICHQQIAKLAELSDKGVPFQMEDTKQFEILVKTLLAIQGKAPVQSEQKKGKKKEEVKVADLLAIVKNSPKEKDG